MNVTKRDTGPCVIGAAFYARRQVERPESLCTGSPYAKLS